LSFIYIYLLFSTCSYSFCFISSFAASFLLFLSMSYLRDDSSPWWWRQQGPLKRWQTSTRLHGAKTQKTSIFIFTAVRTSNPSYLLLILLPFVVCHVLILLHSLPPPLLFYFATYFFLLLFLLFPVRVPNTCSLFEPPSVKLLSANTNL
jgi:hypothetical protein